MRDYGVMRGCHRASHTDVADTSIPNVVVPAYGKQILLPLMGARRQLCWVVGPLCWVQDSHKANGSCPQDL